jgi:DNA invertase Pin-like site-specific DNA recombinase
MEDKDRGRVPREQLDREAFLYVRGAALRQPYERPECIERQYALRRRAIALGWTEDRIHVIDSDCGRSGAGDSQRCGFQHLLTEIELGRAGIVMALDVSRLARRSSDWYLLLETCAAAGTLVLLEEGLYDPRTGDDRRMRGLQGMVPAAGACGIRLPRGDGVSRRETYAR